MSLNRSGLFAGQVWRLVSFVFLPPLTTNPIYVALEIRWDIRMIYLAFPFSWIVTYSLLELYYHRGHWLQGQRLRDALAAQAEKG